MRQAAQWVWTGSVFAAGLGLGRFVLYDLAVGSL